MPSRGKMNSAVARWLRAAVLGGLLALMNAQTTCNDTQAGAAPNAAWPFNYLNTNLNLACPTGWTMRGVNCYQATATKVTWDDASKACSNYGGGLAKVTSFDMNLAVVEYAKAVITDGSMKIWTGLYRKSSDTANNTATWALKDEATDMSVGRWAAGQPDITKGLCVAVDLVADTHLWSFDFCNQKLPFVCQIPALPAGEYLCKDGTTVSEVRVCNNVEDCTDASDEMADMPACASLNVHYLTTPGDITSGAYTDKGATWILQADLGKQIQLTIKTVDTELNVDLVEVYVGGSSLGGSTPVASVSGQSNVHSSYVSPNNWLIVRLSVDGSVGGDGWTGTWSTDFTCEMKALEGYYQKGSVLAGPSAMTADACDASCLGDAGCNAASFNKVAGTCTTHTLFEERYKNAQYTYYGKTCPGEAGATTKPDLPNGGGLVMVTAPTMIYSPFYPIELLSGLSLVWTIQGGEFDTLTMEVMEAKLGTGDSLRIYDGGSTADMHVEITSDPNVDWDRFYRFLFSSGNRALVTLDTASHTENAGFQLKVSLGCRAEMSQFTGYIRTPNVVYPPDPSPDYGRLFSCEWIITTGGKLITFATVPGITNVIDTTAGTNDKYEVYEGGDNTGTLLLNGTDADLITQIQTTQDVYIKFVSDAAFTALGFALRYSIGCPDPSITNVTAQITSATPPNPNPPHYSTAYESYFDMTCVGGYHLNREMYAFLEDGTVNPSNTMVRLYCNDYNTWYSIPDMATNATAGSNEIQSTAFPTCVEKYCGSPFDQVMNGYILNMTSPVFGGIVNFDCFEGFTLTKPDMAAPTDCSAMGTWANLPTCEAETCAPLEAPPFGNLTLIRGNGTTAGSVYTASCDDNFVYEGVISLYCQNGGNWSAAVGTCKALSCLVPEVRHATYGMPAANTSTPNVVPPNVTITYVCDAGYAFPNNSANNTVDSITCMGNNTWNNPIPKCEDVDECANATWCDQSCINYPGSFECFCHPPTSLDNSDRRTCVDVNECMANTHLCGGVSNMCNDTVGGYNCSCTSGERLATAMDVFPGETGMDSWNLVRIDESCIVNEACTVPNITNGLIAPNRTGYTKFQEVKIICDDGFLLNTSVAGELSALSAFCSVPGIWVMDPTSPVDLQIAGCFPAMCPELNTTSAVNPPTVVPSGPVAFRDSVALMCSVSGRDPFNLTRTCLYNSGTQKYELMGDPLECGQITCPVLDSVVAPGSDLNTTFATLSAADRTFNQTFMFGCVNGSAPFGSSSLGNTVVTCQANGTWDLGSLRCPGLAVCTDPGTPAGATQTANNDGYFIDATVTFTCTRDGFGFRSSNSSTLTVTCVSTDSGATADWDMMTPPACEDIVAPVITYCPGSMTINLFEPFNIGSSYPRATDNSGYVSIMLPDPNNALLYPGKVLETATPPSYNFTWTAIDGANNTATCDTLVVVQEEVSGMFLLCTTNSSLIYLSDASPSVTLDIAAIAQINLSPSAFNMYSHTPPYLTLDATSLYQTNVVTFTAQTATGGQSISCRTTITALPAQCSKLELGDPANGMLTCTGTPGAEGYKCTLTCNANYFLQGVASNTIAYNCSGGEWQRDGQPDNWVPDCIASSGKAAQKFTYTVTYAGSGWDPTCETAAKSLLDQEYNSNSPGQLSVDFCGRNAVTNVMSRSSTQTVTTSAISAVVEFTVELEGQESPDCAGAITSLVSNVNTFKSTFRPLEMFSVSCSSGSTVTIEPTEVNIVLSDTAKIIQSCPDGQTLQDAECLPCPPGTYLNATTCERCPIGQYSNASGSAMCEQCPQSSTTLGTGASSVDMCIAQCGENTINAMTGMPPCTWIHNETFWVNSTTAEACPGGTMGGGSGQSNVGMCRNECPLGSRSTSGVEPCTPCPEGTYSDASNPTTTCTSCDPGMITSQGAQITANCSTVTVPIPSCDYCNNRGSCSVPSMVNFYVCECDPGYTGVECEQMLSDPCASNPCFNDGTCMYNSTTGSYACHCKQDVEVTYTMYTEMTVTGGMFLVNGDTSSKASCQQSCTDNADCTHIAYGPASGPNCYLYKGGVISGQTVPTGEGYIGYVQARNGIDLFTGTHCELDNSNACAPSPCMNNASCENTVAFPNGFKCYCNNIGAIVYTGDRCQTSTDVCSVPANACMNDGVCVPIASFRRQCDCKPGYTGDSCETDIDECQLHGNPCYNGGNCTDIVDGFRCQCPPGFSGTFCENKDVSSACSTINCSPGVCVFDPVENMPFCSCAEGLGEGYWTAWVNFQDTSGVERRDEEFLEKIYMPSNENITMTYWNNGLPRWIECRDSDSNMSWVEQTNDTKGLLQNPCSPKFGLICDMYREDEDHYCLDYESRFFFEKTFPQSCSPIDDCAVNPCFHEGVCTDATPGFTCACTSGYEGTVCQHAVDPCGSSPCMHEGTCVTIPGTGYNCTCVTGYGGTHCETNMDDCSCDPMGTDMCQDLLNGFECHCKPGFFGTNCSVDIDECASLPCLNGGNCTDQVDGFQCTCPNGWTGPTCKDLVPSCTGSTCLNGGTCFDQKDRFICACVTGTFGMTCDQVPDICGVADPCVNGGVCSFADGVKNCACTDRFTGDGCQYAKDYCFRSNCSNGATCQPHATGYDCICADGWIGTFCDIKVDPCQGVNCGANGYCALGLCVCTGTFTGPACDKVATRDYDLVLCGAVPTRFFGGFEFGSSGLTAFTLNLWVRFLEPSSNGTFAQIIEVKNLTDPAFVRNVVSLDQTGATFETGTETLTAPYTTTINDGAWHNIITIWDGTTTLTIYADATVAMATASSAVTLPLVASLQLGSGGFKGSISQVILFNSSVTANDAIEFGKHPDVYPSQYGIHHDWSGYTIGGCARRSTPSGAYYPTDNPDNYTAVTVTGCPQSASVYTEDLTAMLDWTAPTFTDSTMVAHNFMSATEGGVFAQGVYDIAYLGTSANPGGVVCAFPGYVRLGNCPTPVASPSGTIIDCYTVDAEHQACWASCPAGKAFLRQVPKLYTCGPSGVWDTSNPFAVFTLPHCGIANNGMVALSVVWKLGLGSVLTSSLDSYKSQLKTKVDAWASSGGVQQGICAASPCSNTAVETTVLDASSRSVQVTLTMDPVPAKVGPSSDIPVEDVVSQAATVDGEFFINTILGADSFVPGSFGITADVSCPTGSEPVGGECVTCTPGTYWDDPTKKCVDCALGMYQAMDNQTSCTSCAPGNTTASTGSASASQCIANCDPGYYFNTTMGGCQPCGIGFYQNLPGQDFCHQCPMGQVTRMDNSTTCNDCFSECPDGTQVMPGAVGECMNCSIGSYRKKGVEDVCIMCPPNVTTSSVASVTIADCDLVLCMDGFYRVGTNPGTCTPCPHGSYRAGMMNMTECMSCGDPMLYTTLGLNSTQMSQCIRFCAAGQYYDMASDSCVECPMGKYKPEGSMYLGATMCLDCPNNAPSTLSLGSTSPANCTNVTCTAGQVWDLADPSAPTCKNCSVGFYQPIALPNTTDTCVMCNASLTTANDGSTKESDCVSFCPDGQEYKNGACQDCAIGFWKNNTITPLGACTMCDNGMVTAGTGATTKANCSQANCPAGNYLKTDTDCQPCPMNQYQDQAQQTSCKPCTPAGYVTTGIGSTSIGNCQNPNLATLSMIVTLNLNYNDYASNPGQIQQLIIEILVIGGVSFLKFEVRTITPGSINAATAVTVDMTQTNANDIETALRNNGTVIDVNTVSNPTGINCTGGNELVTTGGSAMCSPCPFGTYQNATDQDLCRTCPNGHNTSSTGSTEATSCLLICVAGMEAKGGDTCNPCQANFYKDTTGVQDCIACPGKTTTEGDTAATAMSQCVANCTAGTKRDNGACVPCKTGYYQPMANQDQCMACPNKLTTTGTGSTVESECKSTCDLYSDYCFGHGTCQWDSLTGQARCDCNEPYEGDRCQTRGEYQSNTGLIIGAVLGGVGGLLFLVLLIVCVCMVFRKRSPAVPKAEHPHGGYQAQPQMYYPMGVAYPPEPLHMANPFAYDDPWGAQSQFGYSQTGNGYTANGGYHNGGFVPY